MDIVAVSVDEAEEARAFAEEQAYPFPLLIDAEHRVSDRYGVVRGGLARRASFVLDEEGIVRHVDDAVRVSRHGTDVLRRVQSLK